MFCLKNDVCPFDTFSAAVPLEKNVQLNASMPMWCLASARPA